MRGIIGALLREGNYKRSRGSTSGRTGVLYAVPGTARTVAMATSRWLRPRETRSQPISGAAASAAALGESR